MLIRGYSHRLMSSCLCCIRLQAFELTSKAVQFLRFLLLKLPEVRKAEEMQEGRGGALDVGQMLQQLTDVAKKVAAGDS